jgi:hypothetical protein
VNSAATPLHRLVEQGENCAPGKPVVELRVSSIRLVRARHQRPFKPPANAARLFGGQGTALSATAHRGENPRYPFDTSAPLKRGCPSDGAVLRYCAANGRCIARLSFYSRCLNRYGEKPSGYGLTGMRQSVKKILLSAVVLPTIAERHSRTRDQQHARHGRAVERCAGVGVRFVCDGGHSLSTHAPLERYFIERCA